jgi:hypothetical protein
MAQRRMFSKTITNSSQFLMMPQSSQNLYFHLGMNADDDGFCEHFTIMRMTESKPDDLKVLQAKGFVNVFDDKVLVIMDWKENNYIQKDRYTPSKYLETYKRELSLLSQNKDPNQICIQDVSNLDTQDRLGKVRLGKDIIDIEKQIEPYRNEYSSNMITDFILYWNESNSSGKKRWQLEKTWDIKLRLLKWKRNQEKWDHEKSQRFIKDEDKPRERRPGVDSGFTPISFNKAI